MKKLTLKMDDLKVDSFETAQVHATGGTVHGEAITPRCEPFSEYWTCGVWCPETTNPEETAPCQCPIYIDTEAPAC